MTQIKNHALHSVLLVQSHSYRVTTVHAFSRHHQERCMTVIALVCPLCYVAQHIQGPQPRPLPSHSIYKKPLPSILFPSTNIHIHIHPTFTTSNPIAQISSTKPHPTQQFQFQHENVSQRLNHPLPRRRRQHRPSKAPRKAPPEGRGDRAQQHP